jgi:hypothetical protein
MTSAADARAVTEYRIPAGSLRPGDLVNTSPGGDDDWQQVRAVHTLDQPGDGEAARLVRDIGDRYVIVELTDVAPVDSPIYFEGGAALAFGTDGAEDGPVADLLSDPESARTFVYTKFELVTIRS